MVESRQDPRMMMFNKDDDLERNNSLSCEFRKQQRFIIFAASLHDQDRWYHHKYT